jgi:hypothetical protein
MHICVGPQAAPHAPQFAGSVARSTQVAPHNEAFGGHGASASSTMIGPESASGSASASAPPSSPPTGDTHVQRSQKATAGQTIPQAPQLAGSDDVSTQALPHCVRFGPQPALPLEELLEGPPLLDPLPPPLEELLLPAPLLLPLPAGTTHVARTQDSPLAQAAPHPPQLLESESVDVHTLLQTTRPVSHDPSLRGGSPWPPYAAIVFPVPSPTGTSPTQAATPPSRTTKRESGAARRGIGKACRGIGCPPRAR